MKLNALKNTLDRYKSNMYEPCVKMDFVQDIIINYNRGRVRPKNIRLSSYR